MGETEGRELSRRDVGSGVGGVTAALLRRRLGALEGQLGALFLGAGCATCAPWPSLAVTYSEEVQELQRDDDPPAEQWPPELRCPRCGREPQDVVRIVYAETWPPGGRAP